MTNKRPLVSCLMVTPGGDSKFEFLKKSVQCYCRQTYPNKELLIVSDGLSRKDRDRISAHIDSLRRKDIRCLFLDKRHSLGALRNISMDNAKGEIVCQWDDDDLYHPDRIKAQLEYLLRTKKRAVFLRRVLQFFALSRQLFLLDFGRYPPRFHPGTLMCFRDRRIRYPEEGPSSHRFEDMVFLRRYRKKNKIGVIQNMPHLYMYVYHGANTWDHAHHRELSVGLAASTEEMRRKRRTIRRWIKSFDFGPGHINVMSEDGLVPHGAGRNPLVSCLMVTLGGDSRLGLIKKSIDCYCRQTYPNKELLIVGDNLSPKKQAQLLKLVGRFKRDDIRCLFPKGKRTLGALRNISMDNAKSEIVCQWDDDDLYHPDRIKVQLECLLQAGKGAVYLQKFLHFYSSTRELFLVDQSRDYPECHPATLFCFRNPRIRYLEKGSYSRKSEDTVFLHDYRKKSMVSFIADMPHLYTYVYHGSNTWDYVHHRDLSTQLAISTDGMCRQKQAIGRWIGSFDFGPGHINLMSKDGLIPHGAGRNPLVSCLMVTLGGDSRLELIKKSIDCYCRQTYPNKELLIAGDNLSRKDQAQLLRLVGRFKRKDIRCLFPKGKLTLGALRNFSMDNAKSEIVCQWDDDDLYHPDRVKVQLECLLQVGEGAVYLQKFLQFFAPTRELFVVDQGRGYPGCHTASLLCFRRRLVRYPEKGPSARKSEDLSLFHQYLDKNGVNLIADMPQLYAYVFHGTNTWDYTHHRGISTTVAVSGKEMKQKGPALRRWIESFDLGRGPINIMSKEGPVSYAR